MPTFLSDPARTLLIILGFLAVILVVGWLQRRSRVALIAAIIAAVALIGVFLCDLFFESPREEATRKMREISTATKAKKLDDGFKHISESFTYQGLDKKALYEKGKWAQTFEVWGGIEVEGFHRSDVKMLDENKVQIGFDAWASGPASLFKDYHYYCKATFQKEADGQFRLLTLELYKDRTPDAKPIVPDPLR